MRMGKGQSLYRQAKKIIPGGTQLFSKRPEMYLPDLWPAYYQKAKGCEVWDLDGRKYIDACYMGIGTSVLGYADPDVDKAVIAAIKKSTVSTLNCPEEVELARVLCRLHPWAQMVRYSRSGGEAMAMAVRIARAYAGKDIILFCGYHGWHDWYLSSNIADDRSLDGHLLPGLEPAGVPRNLRKTAIPFHFNDLDGFQKVFERYRSRVAAVVMEPARNFYPQEGFLETIREVTKTAGVVLIFDEVSSGWRNAVGGIHLKFKVNPDMAVLGKGMSNGYPMAAVIGRAFVMEGAQKTFMSSTYWTERIGPVSALATIRKMKKCNVPSYLAGVGAKIQEGWKTLAAKHGLKIDVGGIYPLSHFSFQYNEPLVLKTLFTQIMLEKGFLATTAFYASYAHKENHIKKYLKAVDETFHVIAKAIEEGDPSRFLKSRVCDAGFKRLT